MTNEVKSVSLRIIGAPTLEPGVAMELDLEPAVCHLRGDEMRELPTRRFETWPHDVLLFQAPLPATARLEEQIEWIVSKCEEKAAYLVASAERGNQIDISISVIGENRCVSVEISPTIMKRLSSLGIPLVVKSTSLANLWQKPG